MKRILFLIFALALVFCLFVACGDDETCKHRGGKANCISPAICELCDEPYGEVDEDNHTMGEGWSNTADKHTKVYLCCKKAAEDEEDHDWVMGICRDCDYGCTHTGGKANCKSGAVCEICSKIYTEQDVNTHATELVWEKGKEFHKGIYSCCLVVAVEKESHEWVDGVCSECGYECSHIGGKATCTSKALCDICSTPYGELDPKNHANNATWDSSVKSHTKKYECCGVVEIDDVAHMLEGGTCVDCNYYGCHHMGGEATCSNRAVCEICGVAYGMKNPNNHSGTLEIYEKNTYGHKATYTCCSVVIEGNHVYEYYNGICSLCGHDIFSETDATVEETPFVEDDVSDGEKETVLDVTEPDMESDTELDIETALDFFPVATA